MPVSFGIEEIGPTHAERMLAKMHDNRPIRDSRVEALADAMRGGRWELNGEAIKIDRDGKVIDGQHRLRAIMESGMTIKTLVVRGLSPEARWSVDAGARRTPGDVLGMAGYGGTNLLASTARLMWLHERGLLGGRIAAPTNAEYPGIVEAHPSLKEAITFCTNSHGGVLRLTPCVFMRALTMEADPERSDEFFGKVRSGEGLKATEGAYHLRERLLKRHAQQYRLTATAALAIVIKAWNADLIGKRVNLLYWKPTNKEGGEAFPKVLLDAQAVGAE